MARIYCQQSTKKITIDAILRSEHTEADSLQRAIEIQLDQQTLVLTTHNGKLNVYEMSGTGDCCSLPSEIAIGRLKRAMFLKFLQFERDVTGSVENKIDASEFNLQSIDLSGFNTQDVVLPKHCNNIAITGDIAELKQNFKRDCLTLLTVFSETTRSIVVHSPTLDLEGAPPNIGELAIEHQQHHRIMAGIVKTVWGSTTASAQMIIKTSTGNCGEMARLCKHLLDIYFLDLARRFGYDNIKFETFLCSAPGEWNHAIVKLTCSHLDEKIDFMLDPWRGGKAFEYQKGLESQRLFMPTAFPNPEADFSIVKFFDTPSPLTLYELKNLFRDTGVEEQLQETIKKNLSKFAQQNTYRESSNSFQNLSGKFANEKNINQSPNKKPE